MGNITLMKFPGFSVWQIYGEEPISAQLIGKTSVTVFIAELNLKRKCAKYYVMTHRRTANSITTTAYRSIIEPPLFIRETFELEKGADEFILSPYHLTSISEVPIVESENFAVFLSVKLKEEGRIETSITFKAADAQITVPTEENAEFIIKRLTGEE